ncbi:MAG: glycosyltransferase [Aliidongia sp.]
MSRFILFRGSSLYGSVDRMLEHLAAAFRDEGDEATILDVTQPDYAARLRHELAGGVDGFVGLTGIGLDLRAENNLYNALDRPFASIYLDPLLLYWDQIKTPIRRRIVFTTAPGDVDYWAGRTDVPIRHLPHAAELPPALHRLPWRRRDIDILFAGTAPDDPVALRGGWAEHGGAVEARLNDMLDAHDADPLAPLIPVIATHGHPAARLDEPDTLYPYFRTLDLYLRARSRWLTALALLTLPTQLVGPGWDRVIAASTRPVRAILAGEVPAGELAERFGRARLVANSCTPYHGSHERIFQAMAGGGVAFTTETAWLRLMAPAGSLVQFRPGAEDIAARAASLLDPGSAAEAIAADGLRWMVSAHSWRHRVRSIKVGLLSV